MVPSDTSSEPIYLIEPGSVCKASLDNRPWEPPTTLQVGPYHIGVRANDAALDAMVRQAFGAAVVDDGEANANFSLLLAEAPDHSRAAGFHLLYRNSNIQVRTRDPYRMVRGLASHLASLRVDNLDGLLAVQATAFVGDGGAIIGPELLNDQRPNIERRLRMRGLRFVDVPWVFIDRSTMELVVPDSALPIDWSAFDDLASLASVRPDPPVEPGRYPITGWTFTTGDGSSITRGQALATTARGTFSGGTLSLQETLDAVGELMSRVEPTTFAWGSAAEITDALCEVA